MLLRSVAMTTGLVGALDGALDLALDGALLPLTREGIDTILPSSSAGLYVVSTVCLSGGSAIGLISATFVVIRGIG